MPRAAVKTTASKRAATKMGGKRTAGDAGPATPAVAPQAALLPLDYMLAVMRDETADPKRRDDMAKAAAACLQRQQAPPMDARATGDNSATIDLDLTGLSDVQLRQLDAIAAALGGRAGPPAAD